jgi:hydrogenase maturation protease
MEVNRRFFARGGVYPRGWPGGPSQLRAECLIEGADPQIEVTVRFEQAIRRQIVDPAGQPVEELVVTGHRYSSGEETVEREVRLTSLPNRTAAIRVAGSERTELTEGGAPAGAVVWRWEPQHGTVEAWSEEIGPGLRRVRVEIANRLEWDGGARERALLRALRSAHVVMHSPDGAFASLAEPPPRLRGEAAACRNEGLWPVPIGEAGDRRTILASPVVLEDYPRIDVAA